MTSAVGQSKQRSAVAVIYRAGLLAGILDISYVLLYYGLRGVPVADGHRTIPAETILKGIAAAVLGRETAMAGGWSIAALGLAIHFAVAFSVAAVFYVLSRRIEFLTKAWLLSGLIYGAVIWLVMNRLILPLTATPPKTFPPPGWIVILIAHLICVGVPIAFVVSRLSRPKI